MSLSKAISLLKRLAIWLIMGFMFSLTGVAVAQMITWLIAPLNGFTDILCALGAAVGNAIAFVRVFRSKQRYASLVFFMASLYFVGWYCYEYGKLLGTAKDVTVIRFICASVAAGMIAVGYEFVTQFGRNHRNR